MPSICEYRMRDGMICARTALPMDDYCVLHSSFETKEVTAFNAELKALCKMKNYDFSGFVFPRDISLGDMGFARGIPISFSGARFAYGMRMDLERLDNDIDFTNAVFTRPASFSNNTFFGSLTFTRSEFRADASFALTVIRGSARFDGAVFYGTADLSNIDIQKETSFSGVKFVKTALFTGAEFGAATAFERTVFNEDANFSNASFVAATKFDHCSFHGKALFSNAHFVGPASFVKSDFYKESNFSNAVFLSCPDMREARLNVRLDFMSKIKRAGRRGVRE